jgi:DNA polymerase III delta subunit
MERWLEIRAAELGVSLASGTARLLAERVGAYVREGDIDRRRQSELANSELEKLALYRPGGTVGREDVAALVPEAIPASAWGFLDAVAQRRPGPAADLGARLLQDGTPLPVLVAQLHRRLRELIVVADHLAVGTRPAELPRVLRMQPYRAQKLAEQAARWDAPGLDGALEGLVELDLESKGIGLDGSPKPMSDERAALGLQVWLAERVARPA